LLVVVLAGCGSSDPADPLPVPDTLDFAPAYTLILIDGEPLLPWHQPPSGTLVMTGGSVAVTSDTFKARLSGYIQPCPTCDPVALSDSLYGPYQRTSPNSFSVMTTPDRSLGVSLEAAGNGHAARLAFREVVAFLGVFSDFVFEATP
jgi:hypothetical protein